MATLSVNNVNKRAPLSFIRLKRFINIGLTPVVVLTLKGLWTGGEEELNKILLIVTMTIPGLMEAIGLLLAPDTTDVATEDIKSVQP